MKIFEVYEKTPLLIKQLLNVWEKSVRVTHLFEHLIIAERELGGPIAFMGIEGNRLEMLFISPMERGKGLGKQLLQYGIQNYGIQEVSVNEQNPQAIGFYKHLGFETYKRTDYDEEGNPYPLLYMKLV